MLLAADSWSQVEQPLRFELPLNEAEYDVVTAGSQGLYLTSVTPDDNNELVWRVYKLDTVLRQQWARSYVLPANQKLINKYSDDGSLYLLFGRNDPRNRDFELLIFNQHDGQVASYVIRNFIPFTFFDFKVSQSNIVLAGYYNNRPLVITYNLNEGIPVVLPGLFIERGELIQLKTYTNSFDIVMSGRNMFRQETLFVNSYDFKGKLLNSLMLQPEERKSFLFGMLSKVGERQKLVAGTYGKQFSDISRGLFLARVNNGQQAELTYYNYADLENFFSYMKERREKRVLDRISRKKIRNKRIKFSYRLLVHDLMEQDDEIILLGEAFYPKYRNVGSGYAGGGRGQHFSNGLFDNSRIFEGYRYTHAVVLGISKEGKLLWDNSFEINDILSFDLKQFVHASIADDKISLLYVYDNLIRSKTVVASEVIDDKELTPIAMVYEGDQAVEGKTRINGLEAWYNNAFVTFGTQIITNPAVSGVNNGRAVFFINKVINK